MIRIIIAASYAAGLVFTGAIVAIAFLA